MLSKLFRTAEGSMNPWEYFGRTKTDGANVLHYDFRAQHEYVLKVYS